MAKFDLARANSNKVDEKKQLGLTKFNISSSQQGSGA